jgi:hypothetical protein
MDGAAVRHARADARVRWGHRRRLGCLGVEVTQPPLVGHFRAAHISGLDCAEARFSNPDGDALSAARLFVDGGMSLYKAQCTGQVLLDGARISGQLQCTETTFTNPGT